MSQNELLIKLMRTYWTTPMDALRVAGCMNFSGRVSEIRKTIPLDSKWIKLESGKRVKAFKVRRK